LLALSSALALVDTTSSVVFLGYMSIFKPQYMSGYYIGEALSSLVPGLLGLAQGVSGEPHCVNASTSIYNATTGGNITTWRVVATYQEPNFSVRAFFLMMASLLLVSLLAFTVLHFAPFVKREYCSDAAGSVGSDPDSAPDDDEVQKPKDSRGERLDECDVKVKMVTAEASHRECVRDEDGRDYTQPALTTRQFIALLVLNFWVMFLGIGCHKSVEPYAALPYGRRAYSLSVLLSAMGEPAVCLLSLLAPRTSLPRIVAMTLCGSGLFCYQLALALQAPHPPLHGTATGAGLAVSASACAYLTFK
jgi:riboflavin transporter 2